MQKLNPKVKNKLVHIHIPKTGGTWFNKVLKSVGVKTYDHLSVANCLQGSTHLYAREAVDEYEAGIKMIVQTPSLKMGTYDAACKVAIIRNPFDWLVSYYHHRGSDLTGGDSLHEGWDDIVRTHGIQSFDEFVKKFCDPTFKWNHPWIQHSGPFYQMLEVDGKIGVDFLIKNENLKAGTEMLLKYLKIVPPDWKAPEEKVKYSTLRNRDYRAYYNDELRELVEKQFRVELEVLDYKFDQHQLNWYLTRCADIYLRPLTWMQP